MSPALFIWNSSLIELRRAYLPDDSATLGILTVEGVEFHTLELPWMGNARRHSCIPEGRYTLRGRPSKVVHDTSRGRWQDGWEVTDVPDRDHIMFHVGNWPKDTEGCILIGDQFSWERHNGPMVTNSLRAFDTFMKALLSRDEWQIDVFCNTAQYP